MRCEWRLRRATAMEAALLSGAASETALPALFTSGNQSLLKLERYAAGIRRAFYRAHEELRALQREKAREKRRQSADRLDRFLESALGSPAPNAPGEPPPAPQPAPTVQHDSKPMPAGAPSAPDRELAAHKRRNPLFDLGRFLEFALGSPAPNAPGEPPPAPQTSAPTVQHDSKPMPAGAPSAPNSELAAHKPRNPLFDPALGRYPDNRRSSAGGSRRTARARTSLNLNPNRAAVCYHTAHRGDSLPQRGYQNEN